MLPGPGLIPDRDSLLYRASVRKRVHKRRRGHGRVLLGALLLRVGRAGTPPNVSEPIYHGRLHATVSEVVDVGEFLPHYELAAIAVFEGQERPGEEPAVRRRLRAEGIRPRENRGALLVEPGELERLSTAGMLSGSDEVYFAVEWNDEFEPFPGRISGDLADFREAIPLGLHDWMIETQCVLVVGDGGGLNYATTSAELHERLSKRFAPARR